MEISLILQVAQATMAVKNTAYNEYLEEKEKERKKMEENRTFMNSKRNKGNNKN